MSADGAAQGAAASPAVEQLAVPPVEAPAWTDSHAHLTSKELAGDLDGVLERARAAGVTRALTVSCRAGDFEDVVALAERLPATWAAVGVHPHEASLLTDEHLDALRELAARPRVAALGEMGLDYHYEHSPRGAQRDAFRRQLRVAREAGLPVVIHSREAEEDTAAILREEGAVEHGGVLHCFTSSWSLAEAALELGLSISFSGIVTYRSARDLQETARRVPDDRILVETDCPYLAPVPERGRWPNEPALVRHTGAFVAALRGTSPAELAALTTANFLRTFPRTA